MIGHRCHKCLWWDDEHWRVPEGDLGFCRKHKPSVLNNKGELRGEWPLTEMNDFCGEFREDK